ncbi:traf-type zinc finger family protein [Stylonychia lemnae]|uniref:Traf-type zinc finger family protein n=1 Tax=Stylonychia lemnae TaxID=5949 RepID=A0A077ZRK5_STYLE|nr:traf-type zinc finger family protein [Stylonychia lemnae]|eukprot:CDW71136.1 traf-type zinc finger family protein [Stylonychia lemnae]
MDTSISPILSSELENQIKTYPQDTQLKDQSLMDRLVNPEEGVHYQCQVCQDLLQDPRECSKCRNVFCHKCIDKWQSNAHSFQTVCPLRCKGVEMMKISIPFKNQMESLKIYCQNKQFGCNQAVTYGELLKHQSSCEYDLISCLHQGCTQKTLRKFLEDHMATCDYLLIDCEYCKKLIPSGQMDHHLQNQCEMILKDCPVCKQPVPKRTLHHHLDFDCLENEVRCPQQGCQIRCKKKLQKEHIRVDCLFTIVQCSKGCSLDFTRSEVDSHDCIKELAKKLTQAQEKLSDKDHQLSSTKSEMKQIKALCKEKDNRIMDLENQLQFDNIGQLVGQNQVQLNFEEQKEQYYRKDPTFQCETSKSVYQGGSIETILLMTNGHLAISGSSQNYKLAIFDTKGQEETYQLVQEFQDHVNTITGLLEINDRLISCGIDRNIVVYEIIEKHIKVKQPESIQKQTKMNCLLSCFTSKAQSVPEITILKHEYKKQNTIVNAHTSQINCITAVNDQLFATGATKEVKIWKFYECVQVIPTAHSTAILSIKAFKIMNHSTRQLELMLATGSKDKHLKLWSLQQLLQENNQQLQIEESSVEQSHRMRHSSDMVLAHYSQVNTFAQLNDNTLISGTSDGKIQIWKQRQHHPQPGNNSNAVAHQDHQAQQQQYHPQHRNSLNNQQNQNSQRTFQVQHTQQVFTVSTLHIQLLTSYDYNEYPYVALAGMVSKVIIFDVKNMTVIQSLRVLISNWQTFIGVVGMPEERLAVGCLDGTVKIYKASYD